MQDVLHHGREASLPALPAHQGRDDDTPCCTAAVGIQVFFALSVAAAEPEGIEQEEEQVQSQAGERNATQQQQSLQETKPIITHSRHHCPQCRLQAEPRGLSRDAVLKANSGNQLLGRGFCFVFRSHKQETCSLTSSSCLYSVTPHPAFEPQVAEPFCPTRSANSQSQSGMVSSLLQIRGQQI